MSCPGDVQMVPILRETGSEMPEATVHTGRFISHWDPDHGHRPREEAVQLTGNEMPGDKVRSGTRCSHWNPDLGHRRRE